MARNLTPHPTAILHSTQIFRDMFRSRNHLAMTPSLRVNQSVNQETARGNPRPRPRPSLAPASCLRTSTPAVHPALSLRPARALVHDLETISFFGDVSPGRAGRGRRAPASSRREERGLSLRRRRHSFLAVNLSSVLALAIVAFRASKRSP